MGGEETGPDSNLRDVCPEQRARLFQLVPVPGLDENEPMGLVLKTARPFPLEFADELLLRTHALVEFLLILSDDEELDFLGRLGGFTIDGDEVPSCKDDEVSD